MIRGQGGQTVGCNIRDSTTGAAFTGQVIVYIDGDHTGQLQGTVGGGICNARGHGLYDYQPSAAETDFAHIAFTFDGVNALGDTVQIDTITPAEVQALQTATGLGSVTVTELVTDALIEIRIARAGDVPSPDDLDFGVRKLMRLFDRWNAHPRAKYAVGFASYTPTVNHAPHTIGPSSADWAATQRPAKILGANLILNTVSPAVRVPINIRDRAWWLAQAVRDIATSIVTDLYYEPDWPNGTVNLWPVPTATYPIELLTDSLFPVLVATDSVWLPFGYRDAVTLTLAEELAPGFGQTVSADTKRMAREARAVIFALNDDDTPRLETRDSGMPSAGGGGTGGFRWLDRSIR